MSRDTRERMVEELSSLLIRKFITRYVQLSLDTALLQAAAGHSRIAIAFGQKPQDVPGIVDMVPPNAVLCQEIGASTPNLFADRSIDVLYIPGGGNVAMVLSKMWQSKTKVIIFDKISGVAGNSGEFFTEVNLARRCVEV